MKENRLMNIMRTALTVFLMLLVLSKINNPLKKEEPKKEDTKTEEKEEKKEFRNSELILWNTFLKTAKEKGYIHEDNLESIELLEINDYGRYWDKEPYYRYESIHFSFKCKDNTSDCIWKKNKSEYEGENDRYAQVRIDIRDKEYIELNRGVSFNINDNLIPTEPFVYEGEES